MNTKRFEGSRWVAAQIILMAAQLASVLFRRSQWSAPVSCATGVVLISAAAAYGLPGIRALGTNLTPLPEPKANGKLVTDGIYAYVRHPLYASVITAGFGWSLLWRSWPAIILAGLQLLFFRGKAKCEERMLRARFPEYDDYARHVPRFVPVLRTREWSR